MAAAVSFAMDRRAGSPAEALAALEKVLVSAGVKLELLRVMQ